MNRIIIKETVSMAHCPVSDPGPMDATSPTEVLEIFSQQILDMAKQYGDQIVADSVRLVVPYGRPGSMGWDELLDYLIDRLSPQGASDLETALSEEKSLDEQVAATLGALGKGALKWGGKAVGKIKNFFKRNPKKTAAAGTAGGAGAGAAATRTGVAGASGALGAGLGAGAGTLTGAALGSMIDKDVNIANVSTSDKLGVEIARGGAPWLENLIGQTNDLLKQMIALLGQSQPALSQGLTNLDTSIDDLISVETGESTSAVQTRQGLSGGYTGRHDRGTRTAKGKDPEKSKGKAEKTQGKKEK